jgi:hypothetical protein
LNAFHAREKPVPLLSGWIMINVYFCWIATRFYNISTVPEFFCVYLIVFLIRWDLSITRRTNKNACNASTFCWKTCQ